MNNQNDTADQVLRLQNIAYVKQFMQKTSVKLLALVGFIQAIMVGYMLFSVRDVFVKMVEFAAALSPEFSAGSEDAITQFDLMTGALSTVINTSSIIAIVFSLILPVTLLIIIIRSASDNPSVVPSGAVKFLQVIAAIQFVFVIAGSALSLIGSVVTLVNSGNVDTSSVTSGITTTTSSSPNIIGFILSIVVVFLNCLYYYFQLKFLGSIYVSSKGNVLIHNGAKGFGTYSVILAVFIGLITIASTISIIVFNSLINSDTLMSENSLEALLINSIDMIMPIMVVMLIGYVLAFVYQILLAVVAFGFKNTVSEAIKASYSSAQGVNPYNRAGATGNSPFRTFGGDGSYSNYNYNASNNMSQASRQIGAKGDTPVTITKNSPVQEDNNSEKSINLNKVDNNQPVEPVQPSQGFYNNQPVEPVQPSQGFYNNQPVEPVQPSQGFYNNQPVEPVQPSQGFYNNQPAEPVQPSQGFYNNQPAEPVQPSQGFYNNQPAEPVQPSQGFYNKQVTEPVESNQGFYNKQVSEPVQSNQGFYNRQSNNTPDYSDYYNQNTDLNKEPATTASSNDSFYSNGDDYNY